MYSSNDHLIHLVNGKRPFSESIHTWMNHCMHTLI